MPFIVTGYNADGVNGRGAVARENHVADLHSVDKGIQRIFSAIFGKVSLVCDFFFILIPSDSDVPIFQTLGSGGVIPGSFERNLPDVGEGIHSKIFHLDG